MGADAQSLVWIVDDAESVRKSLCAVLETTDMAVRDYPSAAAFLTDFDPAARGFLIVDHHMPEMNGLELLQHLQHLQAQGSLPPTIVITGDGDAALRNKVLAAGGLAMLNKPVDGDELIEMLEKFTANGS